jgi:hypothetical protein
MAGENLTVVHRKTPTAYFDLKNRLLCCPIFKDDISPELYDLFMGHEVGHALWTPYEGVHSAVTKNKTLKGYLNVVEDVRIEKNIREKYQGLRRSFFTAYNELMEMDFFGVKGRNLQELSLIDKINLVTKCGSRIAIQFTEEEQFFLDWANKCASWDEVEECATAIYEWSKENETRTEQDEQLVPQMFDIGDDEEDEDGEQPEQDGESWEDSYDDSDEDQEEDNLPEAPSTGEGDEETEDDDSDEEESEEGENRKETGGSGSINEGSTPDQYDDEEGARESLTEHNAHNNEEQFLSDTNMVRTEIDLKSKDFEQYCKDVHYGYKLVLNDWRDFYTNPESNAVQYYSEKIEPNKAMAAHSFKKIESKNKAIINHMAKEFEMRQTAMSSKYAFTGKTGKLDMNRLAKYQIVDDVFKRVTYLPDGKNHGVNIMIDWSGSIHNEVRDLLEQAVILTQFCRKVSIPHRVYLFSDNIKKDTAVNSEEDYWRNREGHLVEIFSNEMSVKEYKEMMGYVMTLWNSYFVDSIRYGRRHFEKGLATYNEWFSGLSYIDPDQGGWIEVPDVMYPDNKYRLGGTPLDATIIAMRGLLPKFNKAYGIEKSILTVITDGYSHSGNIMDMTDEEREEQKEQMGDEWRVRKERDLIDPINGRVYKYEESNEDWYRNDFLRTQNLLDWVSTTTGVTVTGYFVCGKKKDMTDLLQNMRHETSISYDYDTQNAMWRQARSEGIVCKTHGYNKLFLTAASNLGTDGDETLDDELIGAKKSTIMSKFKKNQRSKSTSRFLTNEFIKEIA